MKKIEMFKLFRMIDIYAQLDIIDIHALFSLSFALRFALSNVSTINKVKGDNTVISLNFHHG